MIDELKRMVKENENILYEGKPSKICFVFEGIFNPLLPFALLWGIFDFSIIGGFLTMDMSEATYFLIPFFLLHLMPVWIYLGGVFLTFRKYRNTYYIVTDRAVYTSSGAFSKVYNTKPFAELSHVDLHRGIFDQWFGVGDIVMTSSHISPGALPATITIASISNYMEVYNLVSKLQEDIYTDIMYPNDKRPPENHGYNTVYKG